MTPGRARRACAVILLTKERTLRQFGQENVNPPLVGQQGVAEFSSGRVSGGGRKRPISSVRRDGATDTEVTCDPQGARRPVEERAGVASCLCAVPPLGARCPGQHQEQSPRHTDRRLSRGVRALLFLLEFLSVRPPDCSGEVHVPGSDAVLREGSCHDGVGVRCHVAWDSAVSWG
ncbi:hypothetical protein TcCL_NonESM10147, partial [Trypanosoma cruzi]